MTYKSNSQSGNIILVIIIVIAVFVAAGTLYYFQVYSPSQQMNKNEAAKNITSPKTTIDDLETQVKGVSTTDPMPADDLDPTTDTAGL